MSNLIALSVDNIVTPRIVVKAPKSEKNTKSGVNPLYGWGFGWYPGSELFAEVVKDYTLDSTDQLMGSLAQWDRFASTVFLGHLRGSSDRILLSDTQPFARSFGGRTWVFAHNGDLRDDWRRNLTLGEDPIFEPMGHSDSEHCFCWLLGKLREAGARSLTEIGWARLHALFTELNQMGSLNVMLSDGQFIAVYRDREEHNTLHWSRFRPPHATLHFENSVLSLSMDGITDARRTYTLFSTKPLTDGAWEPMEPGQLIITSRGSVRWDSTEPSPQRLRRSVATAATQVGDTELPWPRGGRVRCSRRRRPGSGAHCALSPC